MIIAKLLYILVGLAGLGLLTLGVYTLAGEGWAMISASLSCFVVSAFLRKGMAGA